MGQGTIMVLTERPLVVPEPEELITEVGVIKRPPEILGPQTPPTPKVVRRLGDIPSRNHLREGFVFDLETTGTDELSCEIVGIALCSFYGEVWYIPVGHGLYLEEWPFAPEDLPLQGAQLDTQEVLDNLRPAFMDPLIPKAAHNAKYDITVLAQHGLETRGPVFDTMVAGYVLEGPRELSLDKMTQRHLGYSISPIQNLIGRSAPVQFNMSHVPDEDVAKYAGAQVFLTLQLAVLMQAKIAKERLESLLYGIELPLVPVLAEMERTGMLIDTDHLEQLGAKLDTRINELAWAMESIWEEHNNPLLIQWTDGETEELGESVPFNPNSSPQLRKLLFEDFGLRPVKDTRPGSGVPSVDADVLKVLRGQHPFVDLLLEYRQVEKLRNTYVDKLPTLLRNGRVHTDLNQVVVETGRLSSSNPNLQNIPARSELGAEVRKAFIAPFGHKIISADYSQIELRVLAHMSKEAAMIEAFLAGHDFHEATAAQVYGLKMGEVPTDKRRTAKNVNFSVVYGGTEHTLANKYGVPLEVGREFLSTYFAMFQEVARFLEGCKHDTRALGYASTLYGRRRYLPDINLPPINREMKRRIAAAERQATNHPIQGTAGDIIKLAMVACGAVLSDCGFRTRMLMQVHDELLFEAPEDEVEDALALIKETMESVASLDVPLVVDIKAGNNWGEAK